jgi:hypothetical protein
MSKWISVKDRLPEPNVRVLVRDPSIPEFPRNDSNVVIGHLRGTNSYFLSGTWFVPDGFGQVTHWMPLPEPPKDAKE